MTVWAIVAAAVVLGLLLLRTQLASVTVFEFERGLRYHRGRFRGVLEPGSYWIVPRWTAVRRVDVRPALVPVAGQEVLTADGVAVKLSLAVRFQVADPATAVNGVEDFRGAVYTEVQLALRQVVSALPIDELLEKRSGLGRELRALAAEKVRAVGVELLEAEIKDLTLPGELKKIFTQVVKARQEGLAALERARGETAALRNLANAAQMIERNPHLMQLRVLQVLGQQSGNTIVLGLSPGGGPIPISPAEPPGLERGEEAD